MVPATRRRLVAPPRGSGIRYACLRGRTAAPRLARSRAGPGSRRAGARTRPYRYRAGPEPDLERRSRHVCVHACICRGGTNDRRGPAWPTPPPTRAYGAGNAPPLPHLLLRVRRAAAARASPRPAGWRTRPLRRRRRGGGGGGGGVEEVDDEEGEGEGAGGVLRPAAAAPPPRPRLDHEDERPRRPGAQQAGGRRRRARRALRLRRAGRSAAGGSLLLRHCAPYIPSPLKQEHLCEPAARALVRRKHGTCCCRRRVIDIGCGPLRLQSRREWIHKHAWGVGVRGSIAKSREQRTVPGRGLGRRGPHHRSLLRTSRHCAGKAKRLDATSVIPQPA